MRNVWHSVDIDMSLWVCVWEKVRVEVLERVQGRLRAIVGQRVGNNVCRQEELQVRASGQECGL